MNRCSPILTKLSRLVVALWIASAGTAWGAKVILKDGKIYEGNIVAETDGDVLIKTTPVDRPKLIYSDDILSVVRDPVVPKPRDPQRYIAVEMLIGGNFSSADQISIDPAASLWLGGGLRLYPFIELGAGFDWRPAMSGELAISDGTTTRQYERFAAYSGGFSAKVFPFYKYVIWKLEPFVLIGYEWSQMIPKDSGDSLKGSALKTGVGTSWPLTPRLFLEGRFLYHRYSYDRAFFLMREGELNPDIEVNDYSLSTGLSYRF